MDLRTGPGLVQSPGRQDPCLYPCETRKKCLLIVEAEAQASGCRFSQSPFVDKRERCVPRRTRFLVDSEKTVRGSGEESLQLGRESSLSPLWNKLGPLGLPRSV